MYFKKFPNIYYDFKYDSKTTKTAIIKDITQNVRFRKEVLENVTLYDEYDIVDGETPEIIAEKIYGNPEYHWIIMLANQRFDYLKDFPLDQNALAAYTASKYNPTLYSIYKRFIKLVYQELVNYINYWKAKIPKQKKMYIYDVTLNNRVIDTVANLSNSADSVRDELINHDNYDPNIIVTRRKGK